MKRMSIYWILPVLGTLFCIWYITAATSDVIYTDYVRLVNQYLPDVRNPDKFFVADVLTRIPVNYLARMINTGLFHYSTTFDMVLGAVGLGLSALVLGDYCRRKQVGMLWFTLLMVLLFSLNKWEMLTNGTGFAHFLAFAGFYYHYMVLDRMAAERERKGDFLRLLILPFVMTLAVAGPYCAVYSAVLLLSYAWLLAVDLKNRGRVEKKWIFCAAAVVIPLLLYMWSNSYAVEDHAGAVETPLFQVLVDTPSFFLRFFVKSFSSMIIGKEVAENLFSGNLPFFLLGAIVIFSYGLALWLYFSRRIYKITIFPLILMLSGGMNHVLILLSRWIFLDENYGISSRYALQFQVGILGIFLTFALVFAKKRQASPHKKTNVPCYSRRSPVFPAAIAVCILLTAGNVYTTIKEIEKAPYRKERFETKERIAVNFEAESDEILRDTFEYRKSRPDTPEKIRSALTILKDNNWNVFYTAPQRRMYR